MFSKYPGLAALLISPSGDTISISSLQQVLQQQRAAIQENPQLAKTRQCLKVVEEQAVIQRLHQHIELQRSDAGVLYGRGTDGFGALLGSEFDTWELGIFQENLRRGVSQVVRSLLHSNYDALPDAAQRQDTSRSPSLFAKQAELTSRMVFVLQVAYFTITGEPPLTSSGRLAQPILVGAQPSPAGTDRAAPAALTRDVPLAAPSHGDSLLPAPETVLPTPDLARTRHEPAAPAPPPSQPSDGRSPRSHDKISKTHQLTESLKPRGLQRMESTSGLRWPMSLTRRKSKKNLKRTISNPHLLSTTQNMENTIDLGNLPPNPRVHTSAPLRSFSAAHLATTPSAQSTASPADTSVASSPAPLDSRSFLPSSTSCDSSTAAGQAAPYPVAPALPPKWNRSVTAPVPASHGPAKGFDPSHPLPPHSTMERHDLHRVAPPSLHSDPPQPTPPSAGVGENRGYVGLGPMRQPSVQRHEPVSAPVVTQPPGTASPMKSGPISNVDASPNSLQKVYATSATMPSDEPVAVEAVAMPIEEPPALASRNFTAPARSNAMPTDEVCATPPRAQPMASPVRTSPYASRIPSAVRSPVSRLPSVTHTPRSPPLASGTEFLANTPSPTSSRGSGIRRSLLLNMGIDDGKPAAIRPQDTERRGPSMVDTQRQSYASVRARESTGDVITFPSADAPMDSLASPQQRSDAVPKRHEPPASMSLPARAGRQSHGDSFYDVYFSKTRDEDAAARRQPAMATLQDEVSMGHERPLTTQLLDSPRATGARLPARIGSTSNPIWQIVAGLNDRSSIYSELDPQAKRVSDVSALSQRDAIDSSSAALSANERPSLASRVLADQEARAFFKEARTVQPPPTVDLDDMQSISSAGSPELPRTSLPEPAARSEEPLVQVVYYNDEELPEIMDRIARGNNAARIEFRRRSAQPDAAEANSGVAPTEGAKTAAADAPPFDLGSDEDTQLSRVEQSILSLLRPTFASLRGFQSPPTT